MTSTKSDKSGQLWPVLSFLLGAICTVVAVTVYVTGQPEQIRGSIKSLEAATRLEIGALNAGINAGAQHRAELDARLRLVEQTGVQVQEKITNLGGDVVEVRDDVKDLLTEVQSIGREIARQGRTPGP